MGGRGLAHVVVHQDLLRTGLHLVVIVVAYDDGQSGRDGMGRVARVLDDDQHLVLLLLLSIKRPVKAKNNG